MAPSLARVVVSKVGPFFSKGDTDHGVSQFRFPPAWGGGIQWEAEAAETSRQAVPRSRDVMSVLARMSKNLKTS